MIIRAAGIQDAESIARVQVIGWQTAYRGLLDPAYLADLQIPHKADSWTALLATGTPTVLVAERPDGIVGFVAGSPVDAATIELGALYVLPDAQRQGIGRRLVQAFAIRARAAGHQHMMLWVLAANPARQFYEGLNGQPGDQKTVRIGNQDVDEIQYLWSRLSDLADAPEAP